MKTFILLLTVAITFMACDNNEDASNQDELLGKWKLIEIRSHGIVNTIDCKDAVLLDFKTDGLFEVEHFGSNDTNACISMGKIDEGSWVNVGNSLYNIDGDVVTPKFDGDLLIMVSNSGEETESSGVFERQ
ncbi:hypothetical protein JBL43_07115 [Aureibaculum sp. A20]|uniref:Lipocalin-like domain-containing protein n=1 Tax=Aureibaculum flavum TaxID=2795986 RepID=A0ABS0WPU1_9FLAO|nr:hypothetical protein [Aureibaculum flavum]MBJ2174001.1 hypothetical protein [Aureibaculum flavum]